MRREWEKKIQVEPERRMVAVDEKRTLIREKREGIALMEGNRSFRERVASLLSAIIFYTLLTLILLVAVPYGTVEPWWEGAFECAMFFLGLLWVTHGLWSGSWAVGNARVYLISLCDWPHTPSRTRNVWLCTWGLD